MPIKNSLSVRSARPELVVGLRARLLHEAEADVVDVREPVVLLKFLDLHFFLLVFPGGGGVIQSSVFGILYFGFQFSLFCSLV